MLGDSERLEVFHLFTGSWLNGDFMKIQSYMHFLSVGKSYLNKRNVGIPYHPADLALGMRPWRNLACDLGEACTNARRSTG